MINTMVLEIFRIILPFILSSTYFYLTELLLILIILPIILLIATLSRSIPNKTKIPILLFNIIYSLLLLLIIPKLLLIYVIIVIISIIMIVLYRYYEYINKNKRFFKVASIISLISGFILFFFILPTHSRFYIDRFFFLILLIAFILSYMLLFNQKNMIKILSELSEHALDMITLWSYILLLSFSKIIESIANIFALYSALYPLVTFIIIVAIIFFLMFIMSLYVYAVNIDRNLENRIKWIILAAFSISLLAIYLFGKRSIWYIIIGILIFIILMYMYLYIHSCISNNINKRNWNDILGIILGVYIISFTILYPLVEVLYLAIIYMFLTVISLFIYCLLKINKEKDYNKQ